MKKSPVAASSDLDAHINADPRVVHGILNMIRPLFAGSIPTVIATPTNLVAVFTWDNAWHNMDLSAYTSPTARWAIISIGATRTINKPDSYLLFGLYGGTTAYITLQASAETDHDWRTGHVAWIPMNTAQGFSYRLPSNTSTKFAYLLGYV